MKFSYRWLKELSGTDKSPEELAELLLTRAFEVEEVMKYEHGLDGVVVGKVLSCEPHPNADRLKVTEVEASESVLRTFLNIGGGKSLPIVCGAPNVAAGQKVAVALPGAKLPNGAEIKEADIRGAISRGMICAEDELGMGTNHEGIIVLPEDTEIGMPIAEAFGFDDFILDVKILPNRGTDALSHYGLAREIAALEGRGFPAENCFCKRLSEEIGEGKFEVKIEDDEACSAYTGLSFALPENVSNPSPSLPLWGRMLMLGGHPIHPAADIANYLSLLFGQPMHAFDAEKLSGGEVIVRFAKDGEKLVTLDDREITLISEDLVIADAEKPVALAGIMGGKDSAVSSGTRNVFFEIANFNPKTIRRSRVRHGFATESAYLFEHGVDRSWPEVLRGEVVSCFSKYAGAACTGTTGVFADASEERTISFLFARVQELLGVTVPEEDSISILQALGIGAKICDEMLNVTIPTFRPDLEKEADIIEEIGRVYGYEHIAPVAPMLPVVAAKENQEKAAERQIKEFLTHRGFDEIMTYSFYGEEAAMRSSVPLSDHLQLENPMNSGQSYLRSDLSLNLQEKMLENLYRFPAVRLFEFGRTYRKDGYGGVIEEQRIGLAIVEEESGAGDVFYRLKGVVERLFECFRVSGCVFDPIESRSSLYHPGRTAEIRAGGEMIGVLGEANPALFKRMGLRRAAFAELIFSGIVSHSATVIEVAPLPKFPYVSRDLSVLVSDAVPVREVETVIREAGAPLLRETEVFDVYRKDGEKSVSFHLAFGEDDRTITGEEGEKALENIHKAVAEKIGTKNPS